MVELLKRGADLKARNEGGCDSLRLASREGHVAVATILLGRGCPNTRNKNAGVSEHGGVRARLPVDDHRLIHVSSRAHQIESNQIKPSQVNQGSLGAESHLSKQQGRCTTRHTSIETYV